MGSFLRPAELLEARSALAGRPADLRELEDRHILHVLEKQKELGFEIFTDGELRRRSFVSDFTDAVEGFAFDDEVQRFWRASKNQPAWAPSVTGTVKAKLRPVKRLTEHEFSFLKKHSPGAIKMTLPSPTQFPAISFKWGVTDRVYRNHLELLSVITDILKKECSAVAAEGVNYIQIDAPRYSYFMDPKWREWIQREMRIAPDALLDESIKADNACFDAAQRSGAILAIHLCRGNNRSHWYAEGGYDAIAEKMFGALRVDRFLLEYDDARSGSFEPLRFVPRGKTVVLGLVSSKLAELEDAAMLARRIEEAARYVPLENLALSTQCGFASVMEGNLLTEQQQWSKMRLVVEMARMVWK